MKRVLVISAATLILAGCGGQKAPGGGGAGGGVTRKKPLQAGPKQDVVLHWKQGKWWVQLNHGNDEDPSKATTKLPKDTGPTMFEVSIQGKATTFKKDGLTVWENSKSGKAGSTQILGPVVSPDGTTLTFFDLNQGDPVKIYYALHLTDGDVDPIADNGGGGNMD